MLLDYEPPQSTAAKAEALPDSQRLAVFALLAGATQAEAARQAGTSERTLRRWLRDPAFRSALLHARADLWEETTGRLQTAANRAVDTLVSLMEHCDNPHARIRAACWVLKLSLQSVRTDALQVCLAQIEKDLEARLQQAQAVMVGAAAPATLNTEHSALTDDAEPPSGTNNSGGPQGSAGAGQPAAPHYPGHPAYRPASGSHYRTGTSGAAVPRATGQPQPDGRLPSPLARIEALCRRLLPSPRRAGPRLHSALPGVAHAA